MKTTVYTLCVFIFLFVAFPFQSIAREARLTFAPSIRNYTISLPTHNKPTEELDYKTLRIREMAEMLKGHPSEPHTEMLLAMLLVEDGTLTAERRHDCKNGVCFAFGIQGHHICHRGTPLVSQDHGMPHRTYCSWSNGKSPQQQFQEAYPGFSTDWRIQFYEYRKRMDMCLLDNHTVEHCIQMWNSREVGRIQKVRNHVWIIRKALQEKATTVASL